MLCGGAPSDLNTRCRDVLQCKSQGELACGLLVRDQVRKETISFALQFGTSATWRVLAVPDAEEPYVIHEYSQEEFAEIHRRAATCTLHSRRLPADSRLLRCLDAPRPVRAREVANSMQGHP